MKSLKSIRWTVDSASAEFGRHASTLAKNLKRLGIVPGEDGKFSTKEICAAVFGDLDSERLKRAIKENRLLDMEISAGERKLIPAENVKRTVDAMIVSLRQSVLFSQHIPEKAKTEILESLQEIPLNEYFPDTNPNPDNDSAEQSEAA